MPVSPPNVSATLHYVVDGAPSIWAMSGPLAWTFRRIGIEVHSLDVGIPEMSLRYATDHGLIVLRAYGGTRTAKLELTVTGCVDMQTAQDLCDHLARRIGAETMPRAVFVHPAPGDTAASDLVAHTALTAAQRHSQPVALRSSYLH